MYNIITGAVPICFNVKSSYSTDRLLAEDSFDSKNGVNASRLSCAPFDSLSLQSQMHICFSVI